MDRCVREEAEQRRGFDPDVPPKDRAEQKLIFKTRAREWAAKLEVEVVRLVVRPMRVKWASCSTHGHLNFNTELWDFDLSLQDYVIVHELLHLQVPNHGKLWKSLMRAHLGDYEKAEMKLKKLAAESVA